MCAARRLPYRRIGVIDLLSGHLEVQDEFTIGLSDLRKAWASTLPAQFER